MYKRQCVKYVKRKLEAKESLRSHKTPSCRFWFFRIIPLQIGGRLKRVRRRGKPLVQEAFVDDTDDRNQRCRCQVKRDQPFRSTTNDVSQVSNRCNVDFQFLMCAPVEAAEVPEEPQLGSVDVPKRRRLTKKTPAITKAPRPPAYRGDKKKWLYACGPLQAEDQAVVESFQVAFQKAFSIDFYITRYQGKMMESLTPLFQSMLGGMRRLEEQEKEEKEEEARKQLSQELVLPTRVQTEDDLARRARRVCIRLASMANRSFWLSTTEVAVHILTGGDCLQSHYHARLFTRQLQWACQHVQQWAEAVAVGDWDGLAGCLCSTKQPTRWRDSGGHAARVCCCHDLFHWCLWETGILVFA